MLRVEIVVLTTHLMKEVSHLLVKKKELVGTYVTRQKGNKVTKHDVS